MDIANFKESNVTYAEDQIEYRPLPAYKTRDGEVTSCWKPTMRERLSLLFGGRVFVTMLTFNDPLQPLKLSIRRRFTQDKE
jgi:hypothetical protein